MAEGPQRTPVLVGSVVIKKDDTLGHIALRELGSLVERIYGDAARIADRAVTRNDSKARFTFDRTVDRLVTSRLFGFPLMILLFTAVFWLTISGANVPSSMLATLLIDKAHPQQ